ncbi:MarR family winged helix-turn-helix transcriptional regulator [Secundilactobacillus muriivasis]|jgi:DNA-binding MarR family transcriptional regulator
MPNTPEADFVQQVAQLNLAIATHITETLAPYDVNASNYFYLMKIGDHPGIVQREFNDVVHLNPSSITRAVNHLIKKGLVDKRTNPEDRRATQLYLTADGQQITTAINQFIQQLNAELMSRLGPDAQHIFEQLIQLRHSIEQGTAD